MPSPFPGMNPYLEHPSVWHDFHERFCPAAAEAITAKVRPHYVVKIDEHVFIHELDQPRALLGRGDVTLGTTTERPAVAGVTATTTVQLAPTQVRWPSVDEERLSFLEIRDRDSMRLVTVVELLSPSNKKPGPDREQYIGKRAKLLFSAVHLVEIDLLRDGQRMPMEDLLPCDYCVMVSDWRERPKAGLWPIRLRDPLPVIPIPLDPDRPNIELDLQAILQRVYDAAGYEDYIYRRAPSPTLPKDDLQWSRERIS